MLWTLLEGIGRTFCSVEYCRIFAALCNDSNCFAWFPWHWFQFQATGHPRRCPRDLLWPGWGERGESAVRFEAFQAHLFSRSRLPEPRSRSSRGWIWEFDHQKSEFLCGFLRAEREPKTTQAIQMLRACQSSKAAKAHQCISGQQIMSCWRKKEGPWIQEHYPMPYNLRDLASETVIGESQVALWSCAFSAYRCPEVGCKSQSSGKRSPQRWA